MGKKAPAPPPAPDYVGAANATAQANLDAAKYATEANRVNQVTPWGSLTWSKTVDPTKTVAGSATNGAAFNEQAYLAANPDVAAEVASGKLHTGLQHFQQWGKNEGRQGFYNDITTPGAEKWTQTESLSPELQAALNSQFKIQQGQSDLAMQMQGQVADKMKDPFAAPDYKTYMSGVPGVTTNFDNFKYTGSGPNTDVGAALQGVSGVKQSTGSYLSGVPGISAFSGGQQAAGASAGNVVSDASSYVADAGSVNKNSASYTDQARGVSYDAPKLDEQAYQRYTDAAYKASTRLLQDQWGQQNTNLDSQLRLQGLTPGTEAYNNAMQNTLKTQDFTRAQLADQAILTGTNVANQNYASALAGYKALNDAQSQDWTQRMGNFTADNTAQNQAFTQGMSKANFAQTGTDMNAKNGIAAANVNVQATRANNDLALGAYQAQLAAQNQMFSQGAQRFQLDNAAQQQAYNQALGTVEAGNAAQQQAYNQALGTYGANMSAQQAGNAAQAQAYGQAANNYGTDYQAALSGYTMPLNMMNAVLNGNQVQDPNFSGYYTQNPTAGADVLGATSALGSWNQGLYNAKSAATSAANGSTTSLLGTSAMAAATFF